MKRTIKVGTRKSELAMVQTNMIIEALRQIDRELDFEILPISTTGDEILDKPLIEFGGKGVFVAEFEVALLNGRIDLAVHSAKDMPMQLPSGLGIVGIPKREDPRDVLITMKQDLNQDKNCIIGTSSLRRQFQIEQFYQVECKSIRGNVPTRLRKLSDGEYDGIILAAAGLKRLGLDDTKQFHFRYFSTEEFVPAGGQGILAVEGRVEDELTETVYRINDFNTAICLETERKVLQLLNAGCHEAIGVFSYIQEGNIYINAIYDVGGKLQRVQDYSTVNENTALAMRVAKKLDSFA